MMFAKMKKGVRGKSCTFQAVVRTMFVVLLCAAVAVNYSNDMQYLFQEEKGSLVYEVARRDSGGLFTDIDVHAWMLMKDRVKNRINYHVGPAHGIHNPAQWYQENFEPDFTCAHERRIGDPPSGDGPKWVCDPHRIRAKPDCLVYSVGSQGNFMFENAVRKQIGKHCEIHTFDPENTGQKYSHLAPEVRSRIVEGIQH